MKRTAQSIGHPRYIYIFFTTDVDECEAYDACSHYLQRCENSVGGFECQCRVGYERDVDDVNENEDFKECIGQCL